MTSLLPNLPEILENKSMNMIGSTTYNVNAVVDTFSRTMVYNQWTPNNRSYYYTAKIYLHIPYFSSDKGRPDTYSYDVLYKKGKDGKPVNIGQYYKECEKKNKRRRDRKKKVPLDAVKKMVIKDDERRKTLPESYLDDLRLRVEDYAWIKKDEILEKINKEQKEGDPKLRVVQSDAFRVDSSDDMAHAIDIEYYIESSRTVIEEGKDKEVMNQFKNLVAKAMNNFCSNMFAHNIKPLPEGNVKEKKDMFVIPESIATGNFWSNLLDQIKFTVKKIESREMTNSQKRLIPQVVRENDAWYGLYLDEYRKEVSGAIRKRPKVCRITQENVYESTYIVEQKFQLTANTFYLLSKWSGIKIPNILPELKF